MTDTPPSATRGPVWLTPALVAAIVIGLALVRAYMAAQTDLVADEAYYTLWSLHLSPGYYDHPPAIAALIAIGRLFSESSLGVRLAALVSPVLISLALYRTGSLLLGRAPALLAVLWYNLSVGLALSLLATPDVPSTLFWMLGTWAVAEFVARGNPNWWLAVGLFAGLGVLGKYTNLFFGAGILLFILSSRARWSWLTLWQLWAGGLIAALVVLPNLLWNAQNGWITFSFQAGRIAHDPVVADVAANFLELIGAQALFLSPLVVLGLFAAIPVFALRAARWPGLTWPLLSILPGLVYFAIHAARSRVEANWLLPFWPMASLVATALILSGLSGGPLRRALRAILVYLQTGLGLVLTGILFWVAFAHPAGLEHLDRTRDMRGWTETAQALNSLADETGANWIGIPASYGQTGQFATALHFIGSDRPVISIGDRARYRFAPLDAKTLAFPALLIDWQNDPGRLSNWFGTVTRKAVIERSWRGEVMARYTILEVADPTPAFFEAMEDR